MTCMHVKDDMGVEPVPAEVPFAHENPHEKTLFIAGHGFNTPSINNSRFFFLLEATELCNRQLVARGTLPLVAAGTSPNRSSRNPLSRDSSRVRGTRDTLFTQVYKVMCQMFGGVVS